MTHETRTLWSTATTAARLGTAVLLLGCGVEDPASGMESAAMSDGSSAPADGGPAATDGADTDAPDTDDGGGPATGGDDPADPSEGTAADDETGTDTGDGPGVDDEPDPDLRELGSYAVSSESGTAALSTGCSMGYDRWIPAQAPDAPTVILAHGFQGNRSSMVGWAEHWASWGVEVVTPDLCHATIFDADHPQNGVDLRALVDELSLSSVIYAGYSAGGLAAVLAAADDPSAVAVLGLDMVDSDGLGASAAFGVTAPAFDIAGEPSMCNETSNGTAVFLATADGHALRVTEADHCDFQSPADFLCGLTCSGSNGQFDDAAIQTAVRGLSTAVVTWQAGLEPTGAQWWTPGAPYYDELTAAGIVQQP